jgi:hypothetical protein
VATLKLWTSTDGGARWQAASLTPDGNGTYAASYRVPPVHGTDTSVSIRAGAVDSAGASVNQTIYNAYPLTAS